MKRIAKSRFAPYAGAVLGVAVAICCRLLIPVGSGTGTVVFFGILYVSITAATLSGGWGPAIMATLLGAAATEYYALKPLYSIGINPASELGFLVFLALGGLLIGLADRQRRKEAEEVRVSEERFRRLVQVSAQVVWVANARGEITVVNPTAFSATREAALEQRAGISHWLDAVHPEDRQRAAEAWRHALETATPYELELRFRNGAGEYRYIASHAAPILNKDGTVREWIGMSTDVTDKRRIEEKLRQAQKMQSIARLAGGVAHDFNNLLVGVIGNASLALETEPQGSPTVNLLQGIIRSGEHGARLAKQMLDYSGRGRFVLEPVDLSDVVREVIDPIKASTPKNIAIEPSLSHEIPVVEADRTQIRQVLMNMIINATEAIGDEPGIIAVRTGVQELDESFLKQVENEDISPGRYAFLEVTDSGCGMDEATRTKIFDPFFTTKFPGRGLGLAAVYGIVRGHKGAINVSTTPGQGTSFTAYFPVPARIQ